jgi:NADPH:quinone reductase-like Zn-dependent oxidoreductase
MKAMVWTAYGAPEVLQLREVAIPTPEANEVLVKVHAATASTADTELRRLRQPFAFAFAIRLYLGVIRPTRVTILGTEFAGEVQAVGNAVTRYQPGDQVYGYTGLRLGTYAEYLCLPEQPSALASVMAAKPSNVTYEEAAALPFGGLEALHALRSAKLKGGENVAIIGAGGSIGTAAIQLAKHYGAVVTGVDKPAKLPLTRSLGADHVIDCTRDDFTKGGRRYNVILDTISKSPFWGSLNALTEDGIYLNATPGPFGELWLRTLGARTRKRVLRWSAGYTFDDLQALTALVEAGTIRPVIDRRYPLEQMAEAHRYVESGHKQGNVVITLPHAAVT